MSTGFDNNEAACDESLITLANSNAEPSFSRSMNWELVSSRLYSSVFSGTGMASVRWIRQGFQQVRSYIFSFVFHKGSPTIWWDRSQRQHLQPDGKYVVLYQDHSAVCLPTYWKPCPLLLREALTMWKIIYSRTSPLDSFCSIYSVKNIFLTALLETSWNISTVPWFRVWFKWSILGLSEVHKRRQFKFVICFYLYPDRFPLFTLGL